VYGDDALPPTAVFQVPLSQVVDFDTDEHVAPEGADDEYEVHEAACAVVEQPPVAEHERQVTIEQLSYATPDHEPSLQVIGVVFAGHDEPQATELVEYPFQVAPLATTELSGAVHERIETLHEALAPGAVDHEPFEQVEVTLTEVHEEGDVTEDAVYEVHEAPSTAAPHAPDAAQPDEHEP